MPVGHFSGGSQKLQHVGAALGHHSQFGQIGTGPLHGNHTAHQFGARRRFMEVVAGTHHCSPGGVGFFDQRGKLCARSEKFNVDQIGAVGGKNGADKMKILFVGQSDFTAFGFCAEGEKKQLILQGNTELRGAVHDSRKVFCTFKAIDAPFHTIGAQCGKRGSFFKNGGFRGLYNRNNNFGAALADAAAADVDTGHGASPL